MQRVFSLSSSFRPLAGALLCLLAGCQAPRQLPVPNRALVAQADTGQTLEFEGLKYRAYDEGHAYGTFHTYGAFKACPDARSRKVHILLPRDYGKTDARYPVVYMNDGQTAFSAANSVGRTWDVAGTLSQLKAQGAVQDVLVVGMAPPARDQEYTHAPFADGRLCCEAERYAREVASCIKPFIDKHYRTLPDRSHTAIVGSSHGGLSAFFVATRQSATFGYAASLSPSFWAGPDFNYRDDDSKRLADSPLVQPVAGLLANPVQRPTLWIDWGLRRDGGQINDTVERLASKRSREMVQLLQTGFNYRPGQDLFSYEDPTGGHDEHAWGPRFGMIMKTFFPARRAPIRR